MRRCAACGKEPARYSLILHAAAVQGAPPGWWAVVHYCSNLCVFNGGGMHAQSLLARQGMQLEADQCDVCETMEEATSACLGPIT